jgi:hypothetical protein
MREQVASRKPEDLPPADDPAAVEHLRKRLGELEQGQTRITQTMDEAALNQRELQELGSFMGQSEAAFRQEKPDYDEAINHVVQARARELTRYGLNQAQIQETIREEATEIVRTAVARGLNPAQLGYEIAQDRGYVPKQAQQQEETAKPNGGGANAILDAIEQAKKANKSLGSGGGSSPKTLNAEAVLACRRRSSSSFIRRLKAGDDRQSLRYFDDDPPLIPSTCRPQCRRKRGTSKP